jgi:hypothetical protein
MLQGLWWGNAPNPLCFYTQVPSKPEKPRRAPPCTRKGHRPLIPLIYYKNGVQGRVPGGERGSAPHLFGFRWTLSILIKKEEVWRRKPPCSPKGANDAEGGPVGTNVVSKRGPGRQPRDLTQRQWASPPGLPQPAVSTTATLLAMIRSPEPTTQSLPACLAAYMRRSAFSTRSPHWSVLSD